jgi:hypothetical protein
MKDLSSGTPVGFTVLQYLDSTKEDNEVKNGKVNLVALLPNNEATTV